MYIAIAAGLNSVRKLVPESELVTQLTEMYSRDPNLDYYYSIYRYSQKDYEQFKSTKSLSGMSDLKTNTIMFDFDSKSDLNAARQDAVTLVKRLNDKGLDNSKINIYHSGLKGFNVELITDQYFTQSEANSIRQSLAGDLDTNDTSISDVQRIIRAPLSKHNKSGLYKIPLTADELSNLSVKQIAQSAKELRDEHYDTVDQNVNKRIKLPIDILKLKDLKESKKKVEVPEVVGDKPDFSRNKTGLTNAKYALSEGFFEEGERNEATMILASTYMGLGFHKELAYNSLKATYRLRALRLGLPLDTEDRGKLWDCIEHVYSPLWKGGMYSEDTNALLIKTKKRYSIEDKYEANGFLSLNEVDGVFKDFAENIDKNTIKLGIPSFDAHVRVTTSTLVMLLAPPATGKCHGKGTEVIMYDGSIKKVEDVIVGDLLMGDDSTPRQVLSTCSGKEMLYKIKQENGNDYVVNESHILSLKGSSAKRPTSLYGKVFDIALTDYLKKGSDFKKRIKGYKVPVNFDSKPIDLDPYFLGAWLGDGTASKTQITNGDQEVIDYCSSYIKSLGLIEKHYSNDNLHHDYVLGKGVKNPLMTKFRKYNLEDNKHIPMEYLTNSREVRLKLAAGILDTDGYLDPRGMNRYELVTSKENLANDYAYLFRSLGYRFTSKKRIKKYKSFTKGKWYEGAAIAYVCYIAGDNLNEIPCLVPRKKAISSVRRTYQDLTKINIERLEVGEYYGFTLNGNHRYLLSDFTVTHNTSITFGILNATSNDNIKSMFFSLDMAAPQVYQRLAQRHTSLHADAIFSAYQKGDISVIDNIRDTLQEQYKNVKFCFKGAMSVESIRESILKQKEITGEFPKLVVIDYLENITTGFSDPSQSKAYAGRALKDMANEFGICIFLLVQPRLSSGDGANELNSYTSIKGSSVLGEVASQVFTLYRPGFNPKDSKNDDFLSITVVKNRMGQLGRFDYHWTGLTGAIRELTHEESAELKCLLEQKEAEKKGMDDI